MGTSQAAESLGPLQRTAPLPSWGAGPLCAEREYGEGRLVAADSQSARRNGPEKRVDAERMRDIV